MAANNLVYNSYGEKYKVPRVRVSSIKELQRADHIAFHRHCGAYWHHAIVENIDIERNEIIVIEYTNTAGEFVNDNCCPPRIKGMTKAKVVKNQYKFQEKVMYLMKHDRCLDPDDVVLRAQSRLGERDYNPVTLNCEHFAMWCKTGNSTSDQMNKAIDMVADQVMKEVLTQLSKAPGKREIGKKLLTQTASKTRFVIVWFLKKLDVMIQSSLNPSNQIVYVGLRKLFIELLTETGQEVMKIGAGELKEFLIQTALTFWQEVIAAKETWNPAVFKEVLKELLEEIAKTEFREIGRELLTQIAFATRELAIATKKVLTPTAFKEGFKALQEEILTAKTEFYEIGKEFLAQTASKAQHEATKTVVTRAASTAGQEIVKTGTREATEEIVTQAVSTAGEEVVKTGAREGSEEVLTQTASKSAAESGNSLLTGVVCSTVIEGLSAWNDINCARENMIKGTISEEEFRTAVKKRLITGTGNVGGSTVGSAIGQVLIPVPFVGGVIGGIVGGISGSFVGNVVANFLL